MLTVTPPPTLSVILLNWNGRAYLEQCLYALAGQSQPASRVMLVDNGSTDGSVEFVREHFPWVKIRDNGGNIGFAAGNNVALREDDAEITVLLNPDVILYPDCLAALSEALAEDPRIGIAGCRLLYPGGDIIQHAGGFLTHPQAMPGHYGIGERDERQHNMPRDVEYVIGAAMAIRRSLLDEIGLLDEGFFLYFEDTDICRRARRAGYRVVYWPAATGIHIESATAIKGSFAYLQRFHSGRWRYLLKHFPAEEIAGPTLEAEAKWLDRLNPAERRAVTLAYLATQRGLPEIWVARERDGGDPLPPEAQAAVDQGMTGLIARARSAEFDQSGLERLAEAGVLREQPFISNIPLVGPIIASFRSAWNNVASRWYVNHLMTQQNNFNRMTVAQLEQYEAELRGQMELLEEQVVLTVELRRRVEKLQAHVTELRRQMNHRQG